MNLSQLSNILRLRDSTDEGRVASVVNASETISSTKQGLLAWVPGISQIISGLENIITSTLSVKADERRIGTVTIASGQSLSDAFDLQRSVLMGVVMPVDWTAARIGYQVSVDGVTYQPLNVVGVRLSETATASVNISVDPVNLMAWRYIKIQSLNASTLLAENQGADRVIKLVGV